MLARTSKMGDGEDQDFFGTELKDPLNVPHESLTNHQQITIAQIHKSDKLPSETCIAPVQLPKDAAAEVQHKSLFETAKSLHDRL
jgi:hypothetical protein